MGYPRAEAPTVPLDRSLLEVVERGVDEVQAYELADGVWCLRLPVPYPLPKSVNAVLLDAVDGKVLIDTGNLVGLGLPGLERGLELAGSGLGEVTTLFCTHLHPDHAELAPALVEATGVPFLRGAGNDTATDKLHEHDVALAERRTLALQAGVPESELALMVDETAAEHGKVARRDADRVLGEGDALEALSGSWELIPAKGHSPNQYVLYERRRRWMIGADVAYAGGRPFIEWGNSEDPAAATLETLDRVGALPCELFIPGHGAPEGDPTERFQGAREAALDWWRTVRGALADGDATAYEVLLSRLGADPDPDHRQSGLAGVLSVLDHLVARGEVAVEEDDGVDRYALTANGRESLADL
jgi:glyoxylase-like metal-dependent hydrolase (beta-lactamase superfamily II)